MLKKFVPYLVVGASLASLCLFWIGDNCPRMIPVPVLVLLGSFFKGVIDISNEREVQKKRGLS